MGVSFFVDPDLLRDPNTRELRAITLSYTMFPGARLERSRCIGRPAASKVVN